MGKNTKTYLIAGGATAFFFILLVFIWLPFKTVNYKPLDKCFEATVSRKILCNTSGSYTTYSNISPYLIEAVVVSEDDKFFAHNGVDWKELKNSMWLNLKHFSYKRGGSTITQQLVKNAYLTQEKSISRKIKELAISYDIENKYSKKLILEKYLNAIEYGINIWGIHDAALHYFNKQPSDLGILESVYLAILLPSPKKYSQSFRDGKLSYYQKSKIKLIIKRLTRKKVIDSDYAAVLIDDIDGFPWKIDMELLSEEAKAIDLADPTVNFEDVKQELDEDEVIQKFLDDELKEE